MFVRFTMKYARSVPWSAITWTYLFAIKVGVCADAAKETLATLVNSNSRVGLFPEFPRALEFLSYRMHYCEKRSYCGGVALA
jgi:hypothetical protein